jgi:DNA invertase Pin-like site-specific DNA recombinase
MGRMMITMMAGFAELERNLIAERTSTALQHKRNHRQVFNHEPFGYRRDGDTLVPLPGEQGIMARVRALRAAGETLDAIAGILNAEAVPTKRNGKWYARTIANMVNSDLFEAA